MRSTTSRMRGLMRYSFIARVLLFVSIMGPGIITASVDNDAGGIATYSLAGANFGYRFLWTLIPITILLILMQEMGTRMGVMTGKGLADLIRENYRVKLTVLTMLALLATNLSNTMAEFAGLAAGAELFGISRYIAVPLGAIFVWTLVVRANYLLVERIFLVASAVYVVYVLSGILAEPVWGDVIKGTVIPTFQVETSYLLMLVGVIGTSIAPWMQFYVQSSVVEKGILPKEYGNTIIDVVVGSLASGAIMFFIIVACGATIFVEGIQIETAAEAAQALAPLAGKYASVLFAFGLINASLFAASILPLSTSYAISEALGFESGVDRTFKQAPVFFGLYTFLIAAGAVLVLWPNAPLLQIMFLSQVANGVLLPVVLIIMLQLVNNRRLMGEHVNPPILNIVAWPSAVVLSGLALVLLATQFGPGSGQ